MSLIHELEALQDERGHLEKEDLRELARRLAVPQYRLQELVSFYPHFRTTPPAPLHVSVCRDMSCHLGGADGLADRLRDSMVVVASAQYESGETPLVTRIRNAAAVRHDRTDVPASKMKLEIAKILKQEGYIRTFKMIEEGPQGTIRIYLKYADDGEPVIHGLRRVSRPGLRVYRGVQELPKVRNGLGVAVISTNRGVVTDEQARGLQVGGEVLCEIW